MQLNETSQEFSNFRGLQVLDEPGLIPSDASTGVFATEISAVNTDDGTIRLADGCTNWSKAVDYEVSDDYSWPVTTDHSNTVITYNPRNGPGVDVPVILILDDSGMIWIWDDRNAKFVKFYQSPMVYTSKTNQNPSWTTYRFTSSGNNTYNCLLFMNAPGTSSQMQMWNSKFDYPVDSDTTWLVIGGTVSSYFQPTFGVFYNEGISYSYTAYDSTTKTFSGVSPDPTAIDSGSMIIQGPTQYFGDLTDYYRVATAFSTVEPELFTTYKGRLVIGSTSDSRIIFSGSGDPFDFELPPIITPASPVHINNLDGGDTPLALCKVRDSVAILKSDAITTIKLDLDSSGMNVYQTNVIERPKCGPASMVGYANTLNDLMFVAEDGTIQLLEPENVYSVDKMKLTTMSDSVYRLIKDWDHSQSRCAYDKRKWYIATCDPSKGSINNTTLVYDEIKGTWDFRPWKLSGFMVDPYSGDLLGLKTGTPKLLKLDDPATRDFDREVMEHVWRSPRHNFGTNFMRKQLKNIVVRGMISPSTTLKMELLYNGEYPTKVLTTELKGDGSSTVDGSYLFNASTEGYAASAYALQPYMSRTEASDVLISREGMRDFIFSRPLPLDLEPYDIMVRFSSKGENDQWRILSYRIDYELDSALPNKIQLV